MSVKHMVIIYLLRQYVYAPDVQYRYIFPCISMYILVKRDVLSQYIPSYILGQYFTVDDEHSQKFIMAKWTFRGALINLGTPLDFSIESSYPVDEQNLRNIFHMCKKTPDS